MTYKRVAFVLSSLAQGGSERQMVNLAKAIASNGFIVDVIVYYNTDFYKLSESSSLVNYIKLECRSRFDRFIKIHEYYKKYRPDIVISLVDTSAIYCLISSVGIKSKIILTWRNNNERVFNSFIVKCMDAMNDKIVAIVCNSENGKRLWISHRPKDIKKTTVIYNLIAEHISEDNKKKELHNIRTIIVAARVVKDKNAEGLLHALSKLTYEQKKRIRVVWYGRPDDSKEYYNHIIELHNSLNLDGVIEFRDAIANIGEMMEQADAVGLFSHREGFPNAICEGMQRGKPIIMTKVSDYERLIKGNGFLCETNDTEGIYQSLKKFVDCSEEELDIMGRNSLKIFEQLFDNYVSLEKWLRLMGLLENRCDNG